MSQWTHVTAAVRIDAMRFMPKDTKANPDLPALLGPMCTFDNWNDASTLPRGSEGGLEYSISENPHETSLAAYTVAIWGDLRDYGDADEIEQWFAKTFGGLILRGAVVVIEVEYGETRVLTLNAEGKIGKLTEAA